MQELLTQLTSKLGISPEQAQGALDTVLGFVKDKLPAPLASTLDSFLHQGHSGDAAPAADGEAAPAAESHGGVGDILEQAKGMLGGFFK